MTPNFAGHRTPSGAQWPAIVASGIGDVSERTGPGLDPNRRAALNAAKLAALVAGRWARSLGD